MVSRRFRLLASVKDGSKRIRVRALNGGRHVIDASKRHGTAAVKQGRRVFDVMRPQFLILAILTTGFIGAVVIMRVEGNAESKQAAAGLIGGSVALATFFLNKAQKQEHFEKQHEYEKLRFDRQSLDAQFSDILNRMASKNVPIRANAAIRLAEMATQRWPGAGNEKKPENYPFFARAASQLAAALLLEKVSAVRSLIRNALGRMSEFDDSESQTLLCIQINELANVNRTASRSFILRVSEYLSRFVSDDEPDPEEDNIQPIANVIRVVEPRQLDTQNSPSNYAFFFDLSHTNTCEKLTKRFSVLNYGVAQIGKTSHPLKRIDGASVRLIETRDALAQSLRALKAPPSHVQPTDYRAFRTHQKVNINGCILAGADLRRASLQGLDLKHQYLHGAELIDSNLEYAQLSFAKLHGSMMNGVKLMHATLEHANMSSAILTGLDAFSCNFDCCDLSNATMFRARLWGSRFSSVKVKGAKVFNAVFQNGEGNESKRMASEGTNWASADFRQSLFRKSENVELKTWLTTTYPYDDDDEVPF